MAFDCVKCNYLFVEPLAQKLRNNTHIHGITVGNTHHKLLLYADDMLVLFTQPPTLLDCIGELTPLSGYRINWDKSEAMLCLVTVHPPSLSSG